MTDKPLVSVLMTSYNRENYIGEAIESVINSSYKNFELIIVDDCSKDKTVEIAHSYAAKDERIKLYVNEQNLGDYPNRNKAASYATGKYIHYLDSDDIIYPHGLEVKVACMEQFPEAGFGQPALDPVDKPLPVLLTPKEIYYEHFIGRLGHFERAPGSAIIRLDAFKKVGGFSGKRMIGDNELWLTLARSFPMVKFQFQLYWNRVHPEQESNSDYAREYPKLNYYLFTEALKHKDCPLDKSDIITSLEILRKSYKIHVIKSFVKSLLRVK